MWCDTLMVERTVRFHRRVDCESDVAVGHCWMWPLTTAFHTPPHIAQRLTVFDGNTTHLLTQTPGMTHTHTHWCSPWALLNWHIGQQHQCIPATGWIWSLATCQCQAFNTRRNGDKQTCESQPDRGVQDDSKLAVLFTQQGIDTVNMVREVQQKGHILYRGEVTYAWLQTHKGIYFRLGVYNHTEAL